MGPPLRDSAGISPDFARVRTDEATRYTADVPYAPKAMTTDPASTDDPRPDGLRSAPSLVLVNTGNGKGKSSAAFGVMLRAVALDWKVAVVQFVKCGDWKVGEEKVGRQLGVDWYVVRRRVHVGLRQPRARQGARRRTGWARGQGA